MAKKRMAIFPVIIAVFLISCSLTQKLASLANSSPTPSPTQPAATPTQREIVPAITISGDITQLDAVLINLYQQVSPGIVSIVVETDNGFTTGSGFVYDKTGHIITNYHVIQGANLIEVDFPSGRKVTGTAIGNDLVSDISVVKVEVDPSELFPLQLGDSDEINVGQMVVAIGSPFYLSGSMSLGIISAKSRMLESLQSLSSGESYYSGDIIQTDAAINPGNSGGPLFNLSGEVIGVNRAISTDIYTDYGDPLNSGVGFAISSNIVKKVVPCLIEKGYYDYPYLGVVTLSEELTLRDWQALDLGRTSGVYITGVVEGSPADEAGLQAGKIATNISGLRSGGDLITSINGHPIINYSELISYLMAKKSPGERVVLTVLREGQELEIPVILGTRP